MGANADSEDPDISAIKQVMQKQFASLSWTHDKDAHWSAFAATFLPEAQLFPSTRPVGMQTLNQFIERMKSLRVAGTLSTFEKTPLGCEVRVYGNVAVAFAACEMLENGATVTRDVSATILVREEDNWRIAAQAWDNETDIRKIPDVLAKPKPA